MKFKNSSSTAQHSTALGTKGVPDLDPHWDCNISGDILVGNQFTTCILVTLGNTDLKPIKYRNSERSLRTNVKTHSIPRIPHEGHLTIYQSRP